MLNRPLLFVERLGEHDLRVLSGLDGSAPEDLRRRLVADPETAETYLRNPGLFDLLYESPRTDMIRVITPAFAFAVLVHKTVADLDSTTYVLEWVGAGERLPVFDVDSLREYVGDTSRRYLLIELLTSFTRVASGSIWVKTTRGYRRRRFSEFDLMSLAEMVQNLPAQRRHTGYQRLGDVALFLTGVFPDHTARHPLGDLRLARLARFTGVEGSEWSAGGEYLHFLEAAGRRSYDRAASGPYLPADSRESLRDLAANFLLARRFLNYLADRYLHRFETGLMYPVT